MKILLVEPFFGGSHKAWAEGLAQYEEFECTFLTLPSRWWKWRMYGGAVALARRLKALDETFDLVLASSMLDLATFQGLTRRRLADLPHLVYFHENQFAYPLHDDLDQKDNHYCFMNYLTALAADGVAFNSIYNRDTFFDGLEPMLRSFPEYRSMDTIDEIKQKSKVIPLGFDFESMASLAQPASKEDKVPVILWNHRWEYDKNPSEFFGALRKLKESGARFRLIVCGESYQSRPEEFERAKNEFAAEIIHFGFAKSRKEYIELLCQSDIAPVTSLQEFFGISVVEAAWAGAIPLLPRRLSYPEIFPFKNFSEIYYPEGGLAVYLEKMVSSFSQARPLRDRLRKRIARYEWSKIHPLYYSWAAQFVKK